MTDVTQSIPLFQILVAVVYVILALNAGPGLASRKTIIVATGLIPLVVDTIRPDWLVVAQLGFPASIRQLGLLPGAAAVGLYYVAARSLSRTQKARRAMAWVSAGALVAGALLTSANWIVTVGVALAATAVGSGRQWPERSADQSDS